MTLDEPRADADLAAPPASPTGRFSALRRVPLTMWIVTALWGSLLLGASIVWPMTYGYDEAHHFDMAYAYSARPFHFYGPNELHISAATTSIQDTLPGHPPKKQLIDVNIGKRGQRPTLKQFGGATPNNVGPQDQMVQHPPLYYELAGVVFRLPGVANLGWDFQIWLARLLSVLLMLPLPLLCWGAAHRLIGVAMADATPRTVANLSVAAGILPLTLPNLVRDGSAMSNDALLISASSFVMYFLCRVLTGDLSKKTAAGIAVFLAAALLSKGFALVLPPIILAAYLVGARRADDGTSLWRRLVAPVGIAAIGGVVGGLWWLRNLVQYGTLQFDGRQVYGTSIDRPHGQTIHFVPQFITLFVERLWGGIGYADLPQQTPVVTFGIPMLVTIGALLAVLIRTAPGIRLGGAVLLLTPLLTVLVVVQGSWRFYFFDSLAPPASQGRYIYQTIVAVAALAMVGWFTVLSPRVRPLVAPVLLGTAIVINFFAWLMVLRSWFSHHGSAPFFSKTREAIGAALDFAPVPAAVSIALVAVFPAVLSVVAMTAVVRITRELRAEAPLEEDEFDDVLDTDTAAAAAAV